MRHLIYLLVVANLVFFLWNAIQDPVVNEAGQELPPLPDGVRKLVTLEEREQAAVEAVTAAEPPGAGMPLACQTLGPFLSIGDLQAAKARIDQVGYASEQRTSETDVKIGYWIYLPAMKSDKAHEITRLLDSKQDRDYYIGKDNLIALGAFKEISRAQIRLKKLRKYGLDPVLEPHYQTRSVHWLDIDGSGSTDGVLSAIIRDLPDVQLQARACQ
ncbi:MAG: hypothetical protein JSU75_10285 [Gammaproteobacteria bacterium]|nr:MAG: hypothetical protein JSU75_10285 [Gammaproteobacteria bacterium]